MHARYVSGQSPLAELRTYFTAMERTTVHCKHQELSTTSHCTLQPTLPSLAGRVAMMEAPKWKAKSQRPSAVFHQTKRHFCEISPRKMLAMVDGTARR
jgi:hypothetical protein